MCVAPPSSSKKAQHCLVKWLSQSQDLESWIIRNLWKNHEFSRLIKQDYVSGSFQEYVTLHDFSQISFIHKIVLDKLYWFVRYNASELTEHLQGESMRKLIKESFICCIYHVCYWNVILILIFDVILLRLSLRVCMMNEFMYFGPFAGHIEVCKM